MGLIRGGLFVIASVMFFLFLLMGNACLTLYMSLDYDNVKPGLNSLIKDIAKEDMNISDVVDEKYGVMESYCQNNSEYVFKEGDHIFVIPCEVVSQGSENITDYGSSSLVDKVYYQEYQCDFWDCVSKNESPFFLVSEQAKNYWQSKFYLALITLIVLLVLMFFLIEHKTNLPFVAGILLVISSLPFMKLELILSLLKNEFILSFFTILFSKSYTVFLISLSLGIAVLIVGIALKLFSIGFKISHLFKKPEQTSEISENDVKEIVKEEVSKNEIKQAVKEEISKLKKKSIKKK